jgi:hypothetical protein
MDDYTGRWHFSYWYPSNDHDGDDVSEYDVVARNAGKAIIFESEPTADGSYMFSRLVPHEEILSGTWYESTSPTGAFKGAQYSGAGQLILNEDGKTLDGRWAGAGFDHETKKMKVYDGAWKIVRLDDK